MKPKIIFWFLFVCVISPPLCAQQNQKLDSLLQIYENHSDNQAKADLINEIIQIELYSNPVHVKNRIDEYISLCKKINYKKGEGQAYYRKAGYYRYKGVLDSALHFYQKSRQIYEPLNNIGGVLNANVESALVYTEQNKLDFAYERLNHNIDLYENRDSLANGNKGFKFIGTTYHVLANAYLEQGMYNLALKNELKALKLYELTENELYTADALNTLGCIEGELKNYQNAYTYLKEASESYEKHNDVANQVVSLINLGSVYFDMGDYDKAAQYQKEGIEAVKKTNHKPREAVLWSGLGNTYEKLNKLTEAIECQKKAIELNSELGFTNDILSPYSSIGNLYAQINDFEKSKYFLDKVIEQAESNNLIKDASLGYQRRSVLFSKMKQYDLALNDYKKFKAFKDSMFNTSKSRQIEELRAIYDTEKKEQQIALQEQEITVLEQEASISALQKLLMALGLLLSLLGFYALRQKMKRNKLEKEKVDAELEFKKKELTTHALNLARKNETLENLKLKAQELKEKENTSTGYNQLIRSINFDLQDDNNWENFSRYFEEVHKDFNSNVKTKYPSVTSNELRLLALLKMNLSSKEIANILNISPEGIKKARYRLRKKLDLTTEDSLQDLVLTL
ncbi:tetratricopeptide repeat protein [Maribacter algarum]|uniref:Tetratricopeptide repeat protein n=1 Tax=Maribacter algarum (ex Zhang et al. 2020) TaxID=2578118 RepID=A0A5S3PTF0_9FLAO|nr:tetratricopeptide repeat protein [Maribacter algarum]TMM55960.1 tetratricopeptide repeat protein [Maribacter algarum]